MHSIAHLILWSLSDLSAIAESASCHWSERNIFPRMQLLKPHRPSPREIIAFAFQRYTSWCLTILFYSEQVCIDYILSSQRWKDLSNYQCRKTLYLANYNPYNSES